MAQTVTAYLTGEGFPAPLVVNSRNGTHRLYRCDLCDAKAPAHEYLLQALDDKFSTEGVHIDTSVANPSRIARIPGT